MSTVEGGKYIQMHEDSGLRGQRRKGFRFQIRLRLPREFTVRTEGTAMHMVHAV